MQNRIQQVNDNIKSLFTTVIAEPAYGIAHAVFKLMRYSVNNPLKMFASFLMVYQPKVQAFNTSNVGFTSAEPQNRNLMLANQKLKESIKLSDQLLKDQAIDTIIQSELNFAYTKFPDNFQYVDEELQEATPIEKSEELNRINVLPFIEAVALDDARAFQHLIKTIREDPSHSRKAQNYILDRCWFMAARRNRLNIIQFIYENRNQYSFNIFKTDPFIKSENMHRVNTNAMTHACVRSSYDVIYFFKKIKFDKNQKSKFTFYHCARWATGGSDEKPFALLKSLGFDFKREIDSSVIFDLLSNESSYTNKGFELLFKYGVDPNILTEKIYLPPLWMALSANAINANAVEVLLKYKANMYHLTNGLYPVEHALLYNNVEVISLFCKYGYNIHKKNKLNISLVDAVRKKPELKEALFNNPYTRMLAQTAFQSAPENNSTSNNAYSPMHYVSLFAVAICIEMLRRAVKAEIKHINKKTQAQMRRQAIESELKNKNKVAQAEKVKSTTQPKPQLAHASYMVANAEIVQLTPPKDDLIEQAKIKMKEEEIEQQNNEMKQSFALQAHDHPSTHKKLQKYLAIQEKIMEKKRNKEAKQLKMQEKKQTAKEERVKHRTEFQGKLKLQKEIASKLKKEQELAEAKIKLEKPVSENKFFHNTYNLKKPYVNYSHFAIEHAKHIGLLSGIDESKNLQASTGIESTIKYLALMYHLNRCYLAISCHLIQAGKKTSYKAMLSQDIRNLIMHGASEVDMQTLFDSVVPLKKIILHDIVSLNKRNSKQPAASQQEIKEMSELFGEPVQKISFDSIEETPFYQQLSQCLAQGNAVNLEYQDDEKEDEKEDENEDETYLDWVLQKIIPMINTVSSPLFKTWDSQIDIDKSYSEHISALRMLFSMCGEFYNPQRQLRLSKHPAGVFLNKCHEVRNRIGHEFPEVSFFNTLLELCQLAKKLNTQIVNEKDAQFSFAIRAQQEEQGAQSDLRP